MQLYKIPAYDGVDEFLQHVAASRGKLRRGGTADPVAAARLVLQDWNNGAIPYFTQPPKRESAYDSAEVVSGWGKEFNAEEVFATESARVLAALPTPEQRPFMEIETLGSANVRLEEDEVQEMDETEGPTGVSQEAVQKGSSQNAVLYSAEGQFNPHAARAAKKAAKKRAAQSQDEDYDFAEHNWEDEEEAAAAVAGEEEEESDAEDEEASDDEDLEDDDEEQDDGDAMEQ